MKHEVDLNPQSEIQNPKGPLCCPRCGAEMKIISVITDPQLIRHILEHLAAGSESLWLGEASGYRGLPETRPAKRPLMEMGR